MFRTTRPTIAEIDREIDTASHTDLQSPEFLDLQGGLKSGRIRRGFAHDQSRSRLGAGRPAFEAAVSAMEQWKHFDLGWVRVANPSARIEVGQIVAVEVLALGLWSINLSHIIEVAREPLSFGFTYKTTTHHVEEGEERFLLTLNRDSDAVDYDLEAVSRPRSLLARLGFPVTRAFQHRFARESHRRLRETIAE